jgi:acyl carrier protein
MKFACVNNIALATRGIKGIMWLTYLENHSVPMHWEVKMASTEERVQNIVIDLLGVDADRVVPTARFREDLEADSLDLVELIMAFEEEFGGEITDEDAQKITTVGEAISYINTNMSGS